MLHWAPAGARGLGIIQHPRGGCGLCPRALHESTPGEINGFFTPSFEAIGASCEKTYFNIKLRWRCNPMAPAMRLRGPRPSPDTSWDFGHGFQQICWVPPGSGDPGHTALFSLKAGSSGSAPYYGLALMPLIFPFYFFSLLKAPMF